MDRKLAAALDRHIQGLDNPDAPFNQQDPLWMCTECTWCDEDPVEKECYEVSEAWGSKAVTKSVNYFCPKCGGDAAEYDGRYDEPEEPDLEEVDPVDPLDIEYDR